VHSLPEQFDFSGNRRLSCADESLRHAAPSLDPIEAIALKCRRAVAFPLSPPVPMLRGHFFYTGLESALHERL
jgi:hypothetical protein